MALKILVIGGGGREHALVWKLKQGRGVEKIYCAPGNGGIARDAEILPACAEGDWASYIELARSKHIDLTVVGPEAPLVGGIVDAFREAGLKIFGPKAAAARLEGSKIFSKRFMQKYGIPTARFEAFEDPAKALDFLKNLNASGYRLPVVVKADGLAAGKGVSVCLTLAEAEEAVDKILVKKVFGAAGARILIEEGLEGGEISLMALCDGQKIQPLVPARDYKRVFDRNSGPNTGGMGAVAPSPVPGHVRDRIDREILVRFLKGIVQENLGYRGLIYFGLMLTSRGPQVLEFNVRFGDPETEAVLPLMKSDLAKVLTAVCEQKLGETPVEFHDEHCVTVVCASKGYPGAYESNKEIHGLEEAAQMKDSVVFHSGTVRSGDKILTAGGRVLNCTARGKTFEEAKTKAYDILKHVRFEGMHYRKDIGGPNTQAAAHETIAMSSRHPPGRGDLV